MSTKSPPGPHSTLTPRSIYVIGLTTAVRRKTLVDNIRLYVCVCVCVYIHKLVSGDLEMRDHLARRRIYGKKMCVASRARKAGLL